MKKIFHCLFLPALLLFNALYVFAQSTDSAANCHVRISVLTVEPGQELYSIFGHSAIRVQDSLKHSDIVYGWGTFDFDEPNFYLKFMRGNLNYFVSVDPFNDFMQEYKVDQRSVWEQVLILNCTQKDSILSALAINMLPQNRFYQYDFLKNNCTTRIRDMIFAHLPNMEITDSLTLPGISFRDMIHEYLDEGAKPWSKLGIDILLGTPTDKEPNNNSAMFLPDYLMQGLDLTEAGGMPIAERENMIYQGAPCDCLTWMYAPLMVTSVVCVIFFIISIIPIRWAITITKFSDSFFFYITGLIGILIVFMWFFTEHSSTVNNFNIAWALPTNFFFAFFVWRHHKWTRPYFLIVSFIYAVVLATWFFLPQELNIALIPVVLLMMFRSFKLGGKKIPKEYNAEVYF